MDMAEAFIMDAGWNFFVAWGVVLAAASIIAFGRDILAPSPLRKINPSQTGIFTER